MEQDTNQSPNYEIIRGFYRAGEHLSDERVRQEYVRRTRSLIETIVEEQPDYVIYLDKSARPVSWLVRELWDDFAGEAPKPGTLYLNIDREQWRDQVGSGISYIDAGRLERARIDELRAIFATRPVGDNMAGKVASTDETDTILDDKKVLIVDEVKATGDTLDIARAILRRAFPSTEFVSKYWMIPLQVRRPGGAIVNAEVPVWYSEHQVEGRGVGNRDEITSKHSRSRIQRIGRFFLSTAPDPDDRKSKQLRREVEMIGHETEMITAEQRYAERLRSAQG